jgi:hypothetical protein
MKKVASYALFGNHVAHGTRQFYWDHIPAAVRAHHNFYPDWELRFHVDSTYHDDRSKLLRAYEKAGLIKVVHVEENIACCRSMLWRMLPVWDPEVSHVACRDLDSAPCPRDYKCLMQWIESGAAISVINDNYQHTVTMMGGMVGFRTDKFLAKCPWPSWIAMIEAHEGLHLPSGGYDQILMSNSIWNHYYPDVCAHRFAGMPFDGRLTACFDKVPEGHIEGLNPEMCRLADTLMPYLGASSYEIPRACEIYDTHGDPAVRDRVVTAEQNA